MAEKAAACFDVVARALHVSRLRFINSATRRNARITEREIDEKARDSAKRRINGIAMPLGNYSKRNYVVIACIVAIIAFR